MMEYTLSDPSTGDGGVVSTDHIMQQLRDSGENVMGISGDGQFVTIGDAQGQFEVPVSAILQQQGWQVANAVPQNADYGGIDFGMRAAVAKIPTDDLRKSYLETRLRQMGDPQPQVMGQGRDWYAFDPQSGGYKALTNSPEWDMSDAVEFGLEAPRMVASGLAGGATGASGIGAAAAPLAAGAAGGAVDALERGAIAAFDPSYRHLAEENMGTFAKDVGFNAGVDAASMGGLKALGAGARVLSPKLGSAIQAVGEAAPISRTAQGLGQGLEQTGAAVRGLARGADTSLGRDVGAAFIPGAAELQTAGFMAGVPAMATRGIAKGAGLVGESPLVQKYAPRVAAGARGFAEEATAATPRFPSMGERAMGGMESFANRMSQTPRAPSMAPEPSNVASPSQILENLFRKGRSAYGRAFGRMPEGGASIDDLSGVRWIGGEDATRLANDPMHRFAAEETDAASRWAARGRSLGRGIENLEHLGDRAMQGAASISGGVLKGARAAGAAAQGTGYGLRAVGTLTRPLETRAALNRAADYYLTPRAEESMEAALRRRKKSSMLGSNLAKN